MLGSASWALSSRARYGCRWGTIIAGRLLSCRAQLASSCRCIQAGLQLQSWVRHSKGAAAVLTKPPCEHALVGAIMPATFTRVNLRSLLTQRICRALLPLFTIQCVALHRQASLYKLYELTAIASAAVGEPQPQLVELLGALAGEVAPGSSEHLFWTQQYR